MGVPERVVDGLGPALQEASGDLLVPLVEGLTGELDAADTLAAPTARGWPGVFDLDTTPHPAWLGHVTGTDVPPGLALEEQRDYVRDRPAWRRGSLDAKAAAVRALLTGGKRVAFVERTGSEWRLTIRVYEPEATAVTDAQILAAANTQKPVGLVVEAVERYPVFTYADLAADYPNYAEVGAGLVYGQVDVDEAIGTRWHRPAGTTPRYARRTAQAATYADQLAQHATYRSVRDSMEA